VTTLEADTNGDKVADLKLDFTGKISIATGDFAAGSLATSVVINGDNNDNTLNGTGNQETLNGLGGADTLNGNGGDDALDGGAGNDMLDGGTGNDTPCSTGKSRTTKSPTLLAALTSPTAMPRTAMTESMDSSTSSTRNSRTTRSISVLSPS
jgi:hypothetical protein